MPQLHSARVDLASIRRLIDDLGVKDVQLPHFLVDKRQILHISCCVLDHGGGKRSLLPEGVVSLSHQRAYLLLPVVQVGHLEVLG